MQAGASIGPSQVICLCLGFPIWETGLAERKGPARRHPCPAVQPVLTVAFCRDTPAPEPPPGLLMTGPWMGRLTGVSPPWGCAKALHEPLAGNRQLVRSWPGRQDRKGGSSGEAAGALLVPSPDPTAFLRPEAGGTEVKICRRKKRQSKVLPSFTRRTSLEPRLCGVDTGEPQAQTPPSGSSGLSTREGNRLRGLCGKRGTVPLPGHCESQGKGRG